MKEIEKPVGDFIMDNATGVQGSDVYYHYSEVCKLLKLMKKEHKNNLKVK
jgi:hypothetical protein